MSLFVDRIFREPGVPRMPNHLLVAMLMSWATEIRFPGDYPGIDRDVVSAALGLTPPEETTVDELISYFNGLTNAEKDRFFDRLTNLTIAAENGVISKTYFHNRLGLTE